MDEDDNMSAFSGGNGMHNSALESIKLKNNYNNSISIEWLYYD